MEVVGTASPKADINSINRSKNIEWFVKANTIGYYGHLVLRLMGCLVLFYTSRVIYRGRLTMEEIIFSLKHYWRFGTLKPLNSKHFHRVDEKAA